jgi:hypothetical protein
LVNSRTKFCHPGCFSTSRLHTLLLLFVKGFGPDPITDENIKNDDEVMEEDKNVENEDENQYTEIKKDDVDHESERGSVPVGYGRLRDCLHPLLWHS